MVGMQAGAEQAVEGVPPGPRWPRAAQTVLWATRPASVLRYCRPRYGDVFTLRLYGFGDMVIVGDSTAIKGVFTGDHDVFHAGEANSALSPILGRQAPIVLDGERHLRARRLLSPQFHGEAVHRYRERVEAIAAAQVAAWPTGTGIPIRPRMENITFEVILRALIGVSSPDRFERLSRLLRTLLQFNLVDMWAVWLFPRILETPLGRRHPSMRVRSQIRRLLIEEIAAHRADPEDRDDILALIVAAREEDGTPFDDDEIVDQIVSLVVAGHDTTTTGLAWACERLVRHPAVLERLQAELDAGREEYLDAVIKETLRVRPVLYGAWRKLTVPAVVAGHRLPAGSLVFLSISLVQTSGVFPDAQEFRPERFLDGSPPRYTFIPFGGGPRRCVGASFATMEMKAILSTVLRRLDMRPPEDSRPEEPRVHNVTWRPSRGGRVVLTPRRPQNVARGRSPGVRGLTEVA